MKKLIKYMIDSISDTKLKTKLLVSFFLILIVPFITFALISDYRVSSTIESMVQYSTKQAFDQSGDFITYKIAKIKNIINVILVNMDLKQVLSQNPKRMTIQDQIEDMVALTSYMKSFENDEIYSVKIYVNEGFMYSEENVHFLNLNKAQETQWFKDIIKSKDKISWVFLDAEDNLNETQAGKKIIISAVSKIWDANDYSKVIGLIRIDILEDRFYEIVQKALANENSELYIVNSNNEIITTSKDYSKAGTQIKEGIAFEMTQMIDTYEVHSFDEEEYLVASKGIQNTDWKIISITPYDEITSTGKLIIREMLLLIIGLIAIAYFFAFIISVSITKRIRMLIQNIRSIKNGNFEKRELPQGKDEIGELIFNFNEMHNKLSVLVEDQIRIGQEAKNFELIALQSQINPHFLYNTLDMINWTAISNNIYDISDIVQSLSKFYKLSLNSGRNIISIRDEVEHVKMYLNLQNKRYDNIFDLQLDINHEIYDCMVIKIILQPIVENAILHGIMQKENRKGTIKITGKRVDNDIILSIEDDGVGMTQEQSKKVLAEIQPSMNKGYGIRNINDRIKLFYGKEYGLYFESVLGVGTIFFIKIPLRYE